MISFTKRRSLKLGNKFFRNWGFPFGVVTPFSKGGFLLNRNLVENYVNKRCKHKKRGWKVAKKNTQHTNTSKHTWRDAKKIQNLPKINRENREMCIRNGGWNLFSLTGSCEQDQHRKSPKSLRISRSSYVGRFWIWTVTRFLSNKNILKNKRLNHDISVLQKRNLSADLIKGKLQIYNETTSIFL